MEAFQKFEGPRGSVTPELLNAIYAKMQVDAPPKDELEKFIESVYAEREAAEENAKNKPKVFGISVGDGHEGSKIRKCYKSPDKFQTKFDEDNKRVSHQKEYNCMFDFFANSLAAFPDNNLYGTRSGDKYVYSTYSDVNKVILQVAGGLTQTGVKRQQFVGVMLDTCKEWGTVELALWRQAMVPVTLYSTYGKEAIKYIVNHAELEILFASKKNMEILSDICNDCPTLKTIIFVGNNDELNDVKFPDNIKIILYSDLLKLGEDNPVDCANTKSDDHALIIYTSGTTGNPKGVVHNHSGLIAMIVGTVTLVPFTSSDVHLAFLPMAHIMEQFIEGLVYTVGGTICFWSGDIRVLMQDVAIVRPTKFIAVPRLLNRLYVQLRGAFNALEGTKKAVYDAAMASKKKWLAKGCYKSFYDLFVFKKAAAALGGRCGLLATGSAPIDPGMLEFFRIVFSCPVVEGYGMTEVLVTNLTHIDDTSTRSHVGPPSSTVEIKLVDVPEMNYITTTTPPRGEVCFRGPMNLNCYYKNPEKTKEALDEEGWFHSGDIGEFYEDGSLRLIDRIKHIFKLSQGEYVAPEKLEQLFVHSKYVAQIFINGNSLKSALVCVIVPDPVAVESSMKELNISSQDDLFTNDEFKKLVLADIDKIARDAGCFGFEIPKIVTFVTTPFETINLLTPTFKMKRNEARKQFESICEKMFEQLPA